MKSVSVRELFDRDLPMAIAASPAQAAAIGGVYHVRVTGEGGGEWTLDFASSPPSCKRGIYGSAIRTMELAHADLTKALHADARGAFLRRAAVTIGNLPKLPPTVVVLANQVLVDFLVALTGTVIKIDHLQNAPQFQDAWSFIQFSDQLATFGATSKALDVPIPELSLQNYDAIEWVLSGGLFTCDRVRFLVDDLHTTLDATTMQVSLDFDAIVLDVAFVSNDPTLLGQGHAYLIFAFGIPIGWQDYACPDIDIRNFSLHVRIAPTLDANGQVVIASIDAEMRGDIDSGPLSFADDALRKGIAGAVSNALMAKDVKSALGKAIQAMLVRQVKGTFTGFTSLSIDPTGIAATY